LFCSPSSGGIIDTTAYDASNHAAFDTNASATDLVNTGEATLSSAAISTTNFGSGGHNNGVAANTQTDSTYFANGNLPGTITYTLDTSVDTYGYDITQIRSIMGWNAASTTLANQDFDIEVSLVGSDSFANIHTVTYTPFTTGDGNKSSMVTVTDNTGVIASGVDQLRFTYRQTGTWGSSPGAVIRELDVEGVATIPEPSTFALSALGLLGLLACGRRRRFRISDL